MEAWRSSLGSKTDEQLQWISKITCGKQNEIRKRNLPPSSAIIAECDEPAL
jgi:hypothetical protein